MAGRVFLKQVKGWAGAHLHAVLMYVVMVRFGVMVCYGGDIVCYGD